MSRLNRETWEAFLRDPGEETFRSLYDETRDLVYTLCFRILGTEADAGDAFQATYCRILALARGRRGAARTDDAAIGISRIAAREADALRHRRVRRARREVAVGSLEIGKDPGPTPDRIFVRSELRGKVEALVASLPEKLRAPLLLHYFDGLTHEEIAAALGLTRSAVSNRIHRGVRRLEPAARRERLGELAGLLGGIAAASGLLAPPRPLGAAEVFGRASAAGALETSAAGGLLGALGAVGAFKALLAAGAAAVLVCAGLAAISWLAGSGEPPAAARPPALAAGGGPEGALTGPPGAAPVPAGVETGQNALGSSSSRADMPAGGGGTRIFGRITIVGTGEPAAGAMVIAMPGRERATAGADGSYEIEVRGSQAAVGSILGPYLSHLQESDLVPLPLEAGKRNGPVDLVLHRGLVLRGRVTDRERGSPIRGARLTLALGFLEDRTAATGADGAFAFEGLPGMDLDLDVSASGYAWQRTRFRPVEDRDNACDFALEREGVLTVRVVDGEGQPLEGVRVSYHAGDSFAGWERGGSTGTDGAARIRGIDPRNPVSLVLSLKGFEPREPAVARFPAEAREAEATVVMVPADRPAQGAFAGTVTDEAGRPIEGARVEWGPRCRGRADVRTTTDGQGRFRLEGPKGERGRRLSVSAKGRAPAWVIAAEPGTASNPCPVDFVLEPGHLIDGVVTDGEGRPVAGAMVHPSLDDDGEGGVSCEIPGQPGPVDPAITDGEGRFRFEDLPAGQVLLDLRKAGWTEVRGLPAEVDRPAAIVLEPAGTIRGRVVDGATSRPVPAFTVKVSGGGISVSRSSRGERFQDDEGRFALRELDRGRRYRIVVEAPGFPPLSREEIEAGGEDAPEREFLLVRGRRLEGIVVNPEGGGIPGAEIVAAIVEHNLLDWERLDRTDGGPAMAPIRITSDQEGRFAFDEGSEERTLFVRSDGRARRIIRPADRDGSKEEGILRIRLEPASSIAGTLALEGNRWKGATIRVVLQADPNQQFPEVRLDGEGSFRIGDLAPGPYRISVYIRKGNLGFAALTRSVAVRPGEEERIAIGDGLGPCVLSGRVMGADGRPVEGVRVVLSPRFECPYAEFTDHTDERGRYEIDFLPAGEYQASLHKYLESRSDIRELKLSAQVTVAGAATRDFAFGPERTIAVRLRAPAGARMESAFLRTRKAVIPAVGGDRSGPLESGYVRVEAGGEATFHGWFQGNYILEAACRAASGSIAKACLRESAALDNGGGSQDLGEIDLPPQGGGGIEATVLDDRGRSIEWAAVVLEPLFHWEYTSFSGVTAADGRVRIEGLRPGSYTATVRWPQRGLPDGHDGVLPEIERTVQVRGAAAETFRFPARRTVTAKLLFPAGAPPAASVEIERIGWDRGNPRDPDGTFSTKRGILRDGVARFEGVFHGDYILEMTVGNSRWVRFAVPRVFAIEATGGDVDLGTVVVAPAGLGTLSLKIGPASGRCPDGALVHLFPGGDARFPAVSWIPAAEGPVDLGPVPAGAYEVAVTARGFRAEPERVPVAVPAGGSTAPVAVALIPRTEVSGGAYPRAGPWRQILIRKVTARGAGVERTLRPSEGGNEALDGDLDLLPGDALRGGRFRLVDLPAGTCEVLVEAEGYESAKDVMEVEPGRPVQLHFLMDAAGR